MFLSRNASDFGSKRRVWPVIVVTLIILVIVLLSLFGFNALLNSRPALVESTITISGLPSSLEGLRILIIGDLDGNFFGMNQRYLLEAIEGKKFDIVCLPGDITGDGGSASAAESFIRGLDENVPVLFIPGDEDPAAIVAEPHRGISAKSSWVQMIENAGGIYLDAPMSFTFGSSVIWFSPESVFTLDTDALEKSVTDQLASIPPDDVSQEAEYRRLALRYHLERIERIRNARKTMKAADVQAVLTHVPLSSSDMFELRDIVAKDNPLYIDRISLVLSSHLNDGQWRLPFDTVFYLPEGYSQKGGGFFVNCTDLSGQRNAYGIVQYITPGLGVSQTYPWPISMMRVFNQPKISLIKLSSKIQ